MCLFNFFGNKTVGFDHIALESLQNFIWQFFIIPPARRIEAQKYGKILDSWILITTVR